jgi:hypothetical protein
MFNIFKKKFITEEGHQQNTKRLQDLNPQTYELVLTHGVKDGEQKEFRFYFYTSNQNAAENLGKELSINFGYILENVHQTGKDWCVLGETGKMPFHLNEINKWTKEMCEFGYKFDAEFDGWEVAV